MELHEPRRRGGPLAFRGRRLPVCNSPPQGGIFLSMQRICASLPRAVSGRFRKAWGTYSATPADGMNDTSAWPPCRQRTCLHMPARAPSLRKPEHIHARIFHTRTQLWRGIRPPFPRHKKTRRHEPARNLSWMIAVCSGAVWPHALHVWPHALQRLDLGIAEPLGRQRLQQIDATGFRIGDIP